MMKSTNVNEEQEHKIIPPIRSRGKFVAVDLIDLLIGILHEDEWITRGGLMAIVTQAMRYTIITKLILK